jgi:hypothetical protein
MKIHPDILELYAYNYMMPSWAITSSAVAKDHGE